MRNSAIAILEERGIDKEKLKLTGNFENQQYKEAGYIYNSFLKFSKLAFFFYALIVILKIVAISVESETRLIIVALVIWISIILYFVYLIKSFLSQNTFFKLIGKDYGVGGAMVYFLIGMPLYFMMFFYFRKQMKDEMKLIN